METSLVLEDIETVKTVFRLVLRRNGFEVLEAETIDEALECQEKHSGPIHLLVANVVLPGRASGTQAAIELRERLPNLKILFASGTPVEGWTQTDVQNLAKLLTGSYSFVAKPFLPTILVQRIRELLDGTQATTAP